MGFMNDSNVAKLALKRMFFEPFRGYFEMVHKCKKYI